MSTRRLRRALADAFSGRDARLTAWHEAGHVLVQTSLKTATAILSASVLQNVGEDGLLGFSTYPLGALQLKSDLEAEWTILLVLGGGVAQQIGAKGDPFLPSRGDERSWGNIASQYLSSQRRGFYFTTPRNVVELESNTHLLASLREGQLAQLHAFVETNHAVLERHAVALQEARELGREALLPFLHDVVVPPDFPAPEAVPV
jgi:hypothetical protein